MPSQSDKMTIRPFHGRVRVISAGHLIADSTDAIELAETGYRNVYYIPKSDIRMDLFSPSSTVTTCPHKGEASYWTIDTGEQQIADAAWSYEQPLPDASDIAGYLAFSPEKIDAIESTSAGPA